MLRGDQKNSEAESGAILIIVAVCIIMIFGFAALVIDGAYIYTTQNQLHVAADSAALAGASQIIDPSDCAANSTTPNYQARIQAQTFAAFHKAGSAVGQTAINLSLNTGNNPNGDIILGNFDTTSRTFTACPAGNPVNAVRVRSRRTNESEDGIDPSNAPVSTFFAPVLNTVFNSRDVKTKATAMTVTGVRADIPACISSCMFNAGCSLIGITLLPEPGGSLAWSSFNNSSTTPGTITPYITNPGTIPCEGVGQSIYLTNGTVTPVFQMLDDAINDDPGPGDDAGHAVPWNVVIPVCQDACSAPGACTASAGFGTGTGTVIGSTVFSITSVTPTGPAKGINGSFSAPGISPPGQRCFSLVE